MPGNLDVDRIVGGINQQYLADILVRLAKVPTEIPLGPDTFIEPDDPKLVHYVQQVLRPELQSLGVQNIADVPRWSLAVHLRDERVEPVEGDNTYYTAHLDDPQICPVMYEA